MSEVDLSQALQTKEKNGVFGLGTGFIKIDINVAIVKSNNKK
jgi:hypothetical protein